MAKLQGENIVLAILLSAIKIGYMEQSFNYMKDSAVYAVLSFFANTVIFFLSLTPTI